jgi:hypothetical protein
LRIGIPGACRNIDHGSAIRVFAKRRRPSICAVDEEASNVIAGLDPAFHLLARMMDTRVKPAYDGFY